MMTSDERLKRLERVMRMHRLGYEGRVIKRLCHLDPSDAYRLAVKLGVPWTGKPIRGRKGAQKLATKKES